MYLKKIKFPSKIDNSIDKYRKNCLQLINCFFQENNNDSIELKKDSIELRHGDQILELTQEEVICVNKDYSWEDLCIEDMLFLIEYLNDNYIENYNKSLDKMRDFNY